MGARLTYNNNSSPPKAMGVQQLSYLNPFPTSAFGGLLLFDSNIDEDPTITMPPDGVREIGHAGAAYSGATSFRGSYNANESGIIDEEGRTGYRHVWDFGTDKANGTIKCLSLTSREGGNNGYMNDENAFDESFVPYDYCAAYNGLERYIWSNNRFENQNDKSLNTCGFIYARKENDGSTYGLVLDYNNNLVEITLDNPLKLKLSSNLYLPCTSKVLIENLLAYSQNVYFYNNEIHAVRINNGKLQASAYSLEGNRTKNIEITLPRTPYGYWAFYYEGEYYYCSGSYNTFYKTNASGEDLGIGVDMHVFDSRYNVNISTISVQNDGNLYIIYSNSSGANVSSRYATILYPNGKYHSTDRGNSYTPLRFIANTPFKTPFIYVATFNNSVNGNCYLGVDSRYLATINNLSTPVTKTEAQTMKVTYEITET